MECRSPTADERSIVVWQSLWPNRWALPPWGSDDKFSIVFTVHQDEFDAGMMNWICAKDSESEGGNPRYSSDSGRPSRSKTSLSIDPARSRGLRRGSHPQGRETSAVLLTLEYV